MICCRFVFFLVVSIVFSVCEDVSFVAVWAIRTEECVDGTATALQVNLNVLTPPT